VDWLRWLPAFQARGGVQQTAVLKLPPTRIRLFARVMPTLGLQIYRANGCGRVSTTEQEFGQDGVTCEVVLMSGGKVPRGHYQFAGHLKAGSFDPKRRPMLWADQIFRQKGEKRKRTSCLLDPDIDLGWGSRHSGGPREYLYDYPVDNSVICGVGGGSVQ